jgi:multidrug resistance protein MdtO
MRTLAAVAACEILMNAVAWPGIRTSMITCVVTALATANSQTQKQMLRLIGASVGGVVGLGAILFVVPHLDTIAGLVILVASCTYAFAWVAVGSQRSSYAGFQMALAFYLMVLPGFTTSIDLTSIRDRFVGIIIGITAMWIAFFHAHHVFRESPAVG